LSERTVRDGEIGVFSVDSRRVIVTPAVRLGHRIEQITPGA
jgi:hypothetical protein